MATSSAEKPEAVQIILDEHLSIAAVIYTLRYLARGITDGKEPDFQLLRAILDYIVEYPDRWHHPKENLYLFRVLRFCAVFCQPSLTPSRTWRILQEVRPAS